ncbi:MAG: prepilin-type N-terminal cleavage/methylation domain-containing protein [Holosporales bacterium]|jgi:prepilin-type N-terminal cleavage/methylation domain-containing protein|nr:prepilin-type N-terminal cleavage/methylation domain-containing protein [Holosporales bacterium]
MEVMRTVYKRILKYSRLTVTGFSLVEMSMVLLIIGIIVGGMMKGKDLIEAAQIRAVAGDIQILQIAYASYISQYDAIPGDDAGAETRFGASVQNGDGDGRISADDAKKVFAHLHAAGLIDAPNFKIPKIGGSYDVISEDGTAKLRISDNGKPFVAAKQLHLLRAKAEEMNGKGRCELVGDPDLSNGEQQVCIVKISLK